MEFLNWFLNEEVNLVWRIFIASQVLGFLYATILVIIVKPISPKTAQRHFDRIGRAFEFRFLRKFLNRRK